MLPVTPSTICFPINVGPMEPEIFTNYSSPSPTIGFGVSST